MKNIAAILIGLLLVTPLGAQDSVVVVLSDTDSYRAQVLWEAKNKADKAWTDEQDVIAEKYLTGSKDDQSNCMSKIIYKNGWGCGNFSFSKDSVKSSLRFRKRMQGEIRRRKDESRKRWHILGMTDALMEQVILTGGSNE